MMDVAKQSSDYDIVLQALRGPSGTIRWDSRIEALERMQKKIESLRAQPASAAQPVAHQELPAPPRVLGDLIDRAFDPSSMNDVVEGWGRSCFSAGFAHAMYVMQGDDA